MTAIALQFQNTQFDVIDRNSQPWLRVHQIGEALGYKNPDRSMTNLYNSNKDEFTDTMTALVELETDGGKQKVRIFSLRGCHLLAMFARTEIAKQFRKWVLDVLEHHTYLSSDPAPPQLTLADIERLIDAKLKQHPLLESSKGKAIYHAHPPLISQVRVVMDWQIDHLNEQLAQQGYRLTRN